MKSYNIPFTKEALSALPVSKINAANAVLIQIFDATANIDAVENAICVLEGFFPHAKIIGASSAGSIIGSEIDDTNIRISITTFEHTTLHLTHLKQTLPEESFQSGQYLAQSLVTNETKALIIFAEHHSVNAQELIEGIRSIKKDILIAGGIAVHPKESLSALIISNQIVTRQGIVAVALEGENLHLHSHYKSDWIPFGKKLHITHARGNRVYSIDHMRAVDVFKHYLGENALEDFENTRFLFPLVRSSKHTTIARTLVRQYVDGSLEFAGEIQTGEYYRIGFGNLEEMLLNQNLPLEKLKEQQTQTLFVYSCMARRHFMQQEIHKEIAPLTRYGDVSGFFTAGEFYSDGKEAHFLNHTMTMLALSEKPPLKPDQIEHTKRLEKQKFSTLGALSHLLMVTESELKEYHNYLDAKEKLLCQGPVVNFKIDMHTPNGCSYISPNVKKLLGYSAKEFINQEVSLDDLLTPEEKHRLIKEITAYSQSNDIAYESNLKVKSKFGETKYLKLYLAMPKNAPEKDSVMVGYCIDITEQILTQQKIQKLAFYDHITGLPNRELLKKRLSEMIEEAKANRKVCAVTFFDLDKFKDVNDTYGHSTGDKLLQLIANRVRAVLSKDDFIARIGGDEFILIHGNLNRNSVEKNILSTVNRILTIIQEPFNIDGKIAHISTSIGTAIYGIDGESVEDLIKHADMAMYEAKNDPHVHFKFYSHTMKLLRQEELDLKNALKKAVQEKSFTLLYQPQVNIATGEIVGAEALMRWNDPVRGEISPVVFIPLAEEMNLIVEIGEWLLEKVCHKIAYLQEHESLPEHFNTIAVNISPLQFKDPYFVSKVKKIVDLLQIDTRYLEFELTEGVFVSNIGEIVEKMKELKAMGITLSLDDFGTGYSSLQYLKDLPIDTIKIDRSFISNLQENEKDQYLTSTIIQLSQNMQCKIVAEGVENLEQLDFLGKNNCETYQGFYFSKPITFEAFEKLLLQKERTEA